MASVCGRARQALQSSSVSATRNALSKLCGSNSSSFSGASKFPGFTSSSNPRSFQKLFTSSRIPVELGCAVSLMPLHSATASALFNSLLSLHAQSWGCLSEGFATPL
ncbi:protein NUCLEAR FUSION DEFECTIVE 6, chloroplastic/mitochondrial-like [Chenopodium quinoa]|uniref:protein NUCLEAR FUSION DEFECTIVE 6, chloroplastic/mitochondrial-like n=1 Tax=Chenopodium quinoa TaxID=63459 RepID=UPI000B786CA7|nr:protein NUCLEAR FUSION DEFECTIVE 6, chloroplastic/mitochondrial-like [Chenopodium quinoa]